MSPVIAVVLMVAISMVLAGVLFIIVTGLGKTNEQAPAVQFVRDNLNGQLTVVKSYRPIDLTDLEVKLSVDGKFGYNAAANTNPLPADTFEPFSTTPGTDLVAGDRINFCAVGGVARADVTIRVLDPASILVYQHFFTDLDPCL